VNESSALQVAGRHNNDVDSLKVNTETPPEAVATIVPIRPGAVFREGVYNLRSLILIQSFGKAYARAFHPADGGERKFARTNAFFRRERAQIFLRGRIAVSACTD
jgi:hypothetical protein